ncbi:hypothetical protein KRR38_21610 [Novosphingobium sp. G106]|uniref:hypothetical protein n=1 Tax=Novosphingobium sp. G106 TaxID=2849500 RepID=UPI001C2CE5A6|nr:hypothetical protein [Novosphingobium sp. G106]MBV1690206.1 hypothetical protein [Novosphingobium sp. G106]
MKKIAAKVLGAAFATAAALALSACGSSDKASEGAQAENVEMPAEEAMNTADAGATPVADAGTDAAAMASDVAGEAAAGASTAAEATPKPAEKKAPAEKKM